MLSTKGKIGVLVESHFDEIEYRAFNCYFPAQGYEVVYMSYHWDQAALTFEGIDLIEKATARVELSEVDLADYKGIILLGTYAMDRLGYQEEIDSEEPIKGPVVTFLRHAVAAMDAGQLHIGTICHRLWLLAAAPELLQELLQGHQVTCAHKILCDLRNAASTVVLDGRHPSATKVDGQLITVRHPDVVERFMKTFVAALDMQVLYASARR
jgi:protease I